MKFQKIELAAFLLSFSTAAHSESLPEAIAFEAKRLEQLIPENERKGIAEKEIALALDELKPIASDLAQDRVHLAFDRLFNSQDIMESAAFLNRHLAVGSDPEAFTALWESEGKELESEKAALARAGFEGRSSLVRAYAEIATDRILPNHRAARLYARAGAEGGLFYMGSARAASSFASLCQRIQDPPKGRMPRFRGLTEVEAELSKRALDAYGEGDASTTHHRNFIRLDSALKETRKLLEDGYQYGAAASLLEVRLRLGIIGRTGSASPDPDQAGYRSRLLDASMDHSLARSFWERALDLSLSSKEPERLEAAVILEEVLPFYFEILEE